MNPVKFWASPLAQWCLSSSSRMQPVLPHRVIVSIRRVTGCSTALPTEKLHASVTCHQTLTRDKSLGMARSFRAPLRGQNTRGACSTRASGIHVPQPVPGVSSTRRAGALRGDPPAKEGGKPAGSGLMALRPAVLSQGAQPASPSRTGATVRTQHRCREKRDSRGWWPTQSRVKEVKWTRTNGSYVFC